MRHKWILAWAIQIAEMASVCLIQALLLNVSGPWYTLALWIGVPLAGMLTACRAVRRGLLNYAAWLAPPACLFLVHFLVWYYSPSAGAALLTAFTALVGAAAGEVLNQRSRRGKRP